MPSLSPGKGLLAASQEAAEAEAGWAVRSPLSVTHPQSTTPPNPRRPTLAVRTAVCPGHRPRSPRPTRPRSARGPSSQTEQPLFPERGSSFPTVASWGSDISVLGNHRGFFAFGRWFPEKETRLFLFFLSGNADAVIINQWTAHSSCSLDEIGFVFCFF